MNQVFLFSFLNTYPPWIDIGVSTKGIPTPKVHQITINIVIMNVNDLP